LNLLKSFQNRRVQILCSYWTTDVSRVAASGLEIQQIGCRRRTNNSLLKSVQHSAQHFSKPVSGNLAGFKKLSANSKAFALNG
jgi:hypothetical protein